MRKFIQITIFYLLTIFAGAAFSLPAKDISYLQDAALRGDSEAQAALGDIYARGESRPLDWEMAKRWYEAAANNNNTYAQYMLGLIYQLGLTGPTHAQEANQWYLRADSHPDAARGKRLVAQFFADYDSPHYNPEQAFRWYEAAALMDDIEAQTRMGDIYLENRWVKPDVLTAVKWYSKAATQSSPYAQYSLGQLYFTGYETFPQDYEQAVGWFYQAAVQCFVAAQYMMGDLYYTGLGVKQSNVQAYAWWSLVKHISDHPTIQASIDKVTQKMTSDELQLANRLANEYQEEFGSYCNQDINPYLAEFVSRKTPGYTPPSVPEKVRPPQPPKEPLIYQDK